MHHPEDISDADLLRDFSSAQNHAAFARLVERHGAMVYSASMRVVSNHHDAQDITQAAFLALAREAAKLARKPSVAGWLHTVSRRLSLNARKSRESRQRREQAAMSQSSSVTPDPVLSAAFRRELDAALGRLPDRYREPLVLFHLEGASLDEVARRLDLHPSTLRTRLSRAREMLRQVLSRRGVEITSVGVLSGLFAAETKAATFTPTLFTTVLDAATSGGATVSPHVLELAGRAVGGAKITSLTTSVTSLTILMKTKATLITAIVIALAAAGTTIYVVIEGRRAGKETRATGANKSGSNDPRRDLSTPTSRPAMDPLAAISSDRAFEALMESVLLIPDDDERLEAIQERLGMDIPDGVYRAAVAAYGYQVDPESLWWLLVQEWMEVDPRAATLWARRFPGEFGDMVTGRILAGWLAKDEAAATAWGKENVDPKVLEAARKRMQMHASRPAPESSTEIVERLGQMQAEVSGLSETRQADHEQRVKTAELIRDIGQDLSRWARTDPEAAAEFALAIPEKAEIRADWLRQVFEEWARHDPDAALERAKGLASEKERTEALIAVLPSWQLKHPEQIVDEAVDISEIPEDRYQRLIFRLVRDWATANPSGAMDYTMEIDDVEMRNRLAAPVVEAWAKRDSEAARQWVTSQSSGDLRDIGLSELSQWVGMSDFMSAEQLIGEIESPQLRLASINHIVTFGDALEHHLTNALQLLGTLEQIEYLSLLRWAGQVSPEDAPQFRTWLETVHTAGRIKYPGYTNPEGQDPEEVRRYNEKAAANGYEQILEGLAKAPQSD